MSKQLLTLVEESKDDNIALLDVISLFEPKLKKVIFQTQPLYREDLQQDLLIKMIHCIKKYDTNSVPGFWEMKKLHSSYKKE